MLNKQSGFNMLEVLITIAITVVGLLGIVSLQLQSTRSVQDSGNRNQAIWILQDLANRMNANSTALQNYDTDGNYSCGTAPTLCEDHYNANRVVVSSCSAEQVAQFDLWDVACSRGFTLNGRRIRSSHADFISNPVLNVDVDSDTNSATLQLTWDVRTSGKSGNNAKSYLNSTDANAALTDSITREIQL